MFTKFTGSIYSFGATLAFLAASTAALADVVLHSPRDYQVFQRMTSDHGLINIEGTISATAINVLIEARLMDAKRDGDWVKIANLKPGETHFHGSIKGKAGNWQRLEVRAQSEKQTAMVDHVGIGEIFLIAGQSNSANHGEEKQKITGRMVVAFDGENWKIADDPQPGASGNNGSFIPPFADAIAQRFEVPVGIVALGAGGTSVREWLPSGVEFPNPPTVTNNVRKLKEGSWESHGTLYRRFVETAKQLGTNGFRAVLWHQGESDANQADVTRTLEGKLYQEYLAFIITHSRHEAGWNIPWFTAKATYHTPDDTGSPDIRAAQEAVWRSGVAMEGPDTDSLTGEMREAGGRGVHFSGKGLKAHAMLWVEKIAPWLDEQVQR